MPINRPLLLLTRPEAQARQFLEQLDQDVVGCVDVVISPLITIVASDDTPKLADNVGLIFTSINGVASTARMTDIRGQVAYCVGPATTEAARQAGWDAIQAGRNADGLVATLIDKKPKGPLLHLRGLHTRGSVASRLSDAGVTTSEHVAYTQCAQSLSDDALGALEGDRMVIVPLFSPRSAELFARQAPSRSFLIAALSDAVAQNVGRLNHVETYVAQTPDAQAIGRLVEKLLRAAVSG